MELGPRIEAIRHPLSTRQSKILRRVGGLSGAEQRDVDTSFYDRFRNNSASYPPETS